MEAHRIPKKVPQQTIYSKRRVGKSRKGCEDGVGEAAVAVLGTRAWKTKAKHRE
jgi:hypothetical protein